MWPLPPDLSTHNLSLSTSSSTLSIHSSWKLPSRATASSWLLWLLALEADLSCDSLLSCLSGFGSECLSWNLSSLTNPREIIYFQSVQLFLHARLRMTASKLSIFVPKLEISLTLLINCSNFGHWEIFQKDLSFLQVLLLLLLLLFSVYLLSAPT